ncbi:hypothetical protein [Vallitalea guaymasensis]|uniref:hypothetical protein n=1 Tax=Vallitalea guaymasensis TaxID=1185412 RepID=UPI000DE50C1B|nr:hypothetical protein [Vallitalea guaymasensis]
MAVTEYRTVTEVFNKDGLGEAELKCRELKYKLKEYQSDGTESTVLSTVISGVFLIMGVPAMAVIVGLINAGVSLKNMTEDHLQTAVRECQYALESAETTLHNYRDKYDLAKIQMTYKNYESEHGLITIPTSVEVIAFHCKSGGWKY